MRVNHSRGQARLCEPQHVGKSASVGMIARLGRERSGCGCKLTLTNEMDPKWADYASQTEAGWTKMLNALAQSQTTK
jgi:hypothetical protein